MRKEFAGYSFDLITCIEPEREASGEVREFMPQSRYRNLRNLSLNKYGAGPFCQFRISSNLPFASVYVLTVGGNIAYVGECQNLSDRFSARGYGTIHPRNCFMHGQPTNCKINNLILQETKLNQKIELWFYKTVNRKSLEAEFIRKFQPMWNIQLKW